MRTAIIIPARYASSRFPAKPLTPIRGCDGSAKPLVQWSHEAAACVAGADAVYVATDDSRIADCVRAFGGKVLMTAESCANGTERVAACAEQLPDTDLFVNFQGDALLTPPDFVAALIDHMQADQSATVATAAVCASQETYRHLAADAAQGRVGGTTVVLDRNSRALYFSKRILPHLPAGTVPDEGNPVYLHLGLYAYRREALTRYMEMGPTVLENVEGLEQLRFLVHGDPVAVVTLPEPPYPMVEVNNPGDVAIVERILAQRGQAPRPVLISTL